PNRTVFDKNTYPTHRSTLCALHQALVLIKLIAPSQWDPTQEEGLYNRFKAQIQAISASTAYYPIHYHALLLEQSLQRLERSKDLSEEIFRRVVHGIKAMFYLYQGAPFPHSSKPNLDYLLEGFKNLKAAFACEGIEVKPWYACLLDLGNATLLSLKYPDKYGDFEECLQSLKEKEASMQNEQDRKALRFGIVQQLRLLALHGPTGEVRKQSIQWLEDLTKPEAWAGDKEVMEGLLDGLAAIVVHSQGEEKKQAEGALESLTSPLREVPASRFLPWRTARRREAAGQKAIKEWLGGQELSAKLRAMPAPAAPPASGGLFSKINSKLIAEEDELGKTALHFIIQRNKENIRVSQGIQNIVLSLIRHAARAGHKKAIKAFLEVKPNEVYELDSRLLLLEEAVQHNQREIIPFLMGVIEGKTALRKIALKEDADSEVFKALLKQGVLPDENMLKVAIIKGRVEIVGPILEKFEEKDIEAIGGYDTLLQLANDSTQRNKEGVVEVLETYKFLYDSESDSESEPAYVEDGNLQKVLYHGQTILHLAAKTNKKIGHLFWRAHPGAFGAINGDGESPLSLIQSNSTWAALWAIRGGKYPWRIMRDHPWAPGLGVAVVGALLCGYVLTNHLWPEGGQPIEPMEYGLTPLHGAAFNGHQAMVEYLQSEGEDIDATDKYGMTPLQWAAYKGQKAMVEYLLSQGADISATDKDGFTPLHGAAFRGHQAVVASLLEAGAEVEATDKDGLTPLQRAAEKGHQAVVDYLGGKGAEEARQALRVYYRRPDFAQVPSLFEGEAPKHVDSLQCELKLIEQVKVKVKEDREGKEDLEGPQDHLSTHHERLEWVKNPIAFEDLFKSRSTKPDEPAREIQKVLLVGEAGTGKTTLSRKLAYSWAKGEWDQTFEAVYVLPVRELQKERYDDKGLFRRETLATAIANHCFPPMEEDEEYKRLRRQISEELERPTTLLVLDGLDERYGASEKLLEQAKAGSHKLLLLSRPYGIEQERSLADIEIEHAG
ncbi:MAG: ankyrin repeat domain-containing protein, partial [Cytophagales bacterium]|nr:ankyrin repeat domain-containing protein [Cytophagales bacterium]